MNSLQLSCLMNRTAIIEYLLLRGADPNCISKYSESD
jgi:hypothetical protein